ncbi:hypothetical protein MgSA37_01918 [Mucilaginibacter gotjawali]|nr:hypothetical protein MgSA37_01918 [Mucilaginibacter gotjawali]
MKIKQKLLKVIKTKNWLLTLLLVVSILKVSAQQVNISTNLFPPYSPYYADYSGVNASKVLVIVQNLTQNTLKIKLSGRLESRSVDIHTRDNFVPLQPLILGPHEIVQLNGNRLKDIFDINNLSVKGIDINTLALTSRIPEGNYSFCINAIDYNDNHTVLSAPGTGCSFLPITYPDAPVLSSPGKVVQATFPQSLIFSWFNPAAVPLGTQYHIELAEMPDVNADPNHVLDATSFPMLSQTVSSYSYLYGALNLQLIPGRKYAWRVSASDPSGKIVFKHNGISPASSFTYVNNDGGPPVRLAQQANLFVTTPSCDTPTPTVLLGPNVNLQMAWLWQNQVASIQKFGTLDTMLIKHYDQIATASGPVKLGKYQLDFSLADKTKVKTYTVDAPLQNFSITKGTALNDGFVIGKQYIVAVTSFDINGHVIEKATSCPWLLKDEQDAAAPKLNIRGRLVYALDSIGTVHGANNASITVQLSDNPKPGRIANDKDYSSATTDGNGNFSVQLTQGTSDTGKKYLLVRINNPYYRQPGSNVVILKIPPIKYAANNQVVQAIQDTLKLGDIKTLAYSNTLTVNVKKGFPPKINEQDYKDLFGEQNSGYYTDLPVDTMTVDTIARVPDGTRVIIYRKAKAIDIPFYEAGTTVGAPGTPYYNQDIGKLSAYGLNGHFLLVAEGQTHSSVTGASTVVFDHLLCNFEKDDGYYIKAILPDTGINHQSELSGPEQLFSFNPSGEAGTYFKTKADYHIISQKPPIAHVKGKVMYQWPSLPGVLHPYANHKVFVTYRLSPISDNGISPDNCQTVTYKQISKGANGLPVITDYDISDQYRNITVGQGITDAQGNFDITVLTMNQAGTVPGVQATVSGNPCGGLNGDLGNGKINNLHTQAGKDAGDGGNNIGNGAVDGLDFSKGMGGIKGLYINNTINDLKNTDPSNAGIATDVPAVKAINGPSPAEEPFEQGQDIGGSGSLRRYFTIDSIPAVITQANYPANSANYFVVQPFQTLDLGVIVTQVKELEKYTIKVTNNSPDSSNLLNGALVTVYRHPLTAGEFIPDGEGSFKHRFDPLPSAGFSGADQNTKPEEWVIDHSFQLTVDPAKGHIVELGNLRLIPPTYDYYNAYSQYMVQVSPGNSSASGKFKVVSQQLYYRENNTMTIKVEPVYSRIAGRIINDNTNKPIPGGLVLLRAGPFLFAHCDTTVIADENGYYEVNNDPKKHFKWADNTALWISVIQLGYNFMPYYKANPPMNAFGQNYFNISRLMPGREVNFTTFDADTKTRVTGVSMTKDSTTYQSDNLGQYKFKISSVATDTIHIYPTDLAYFEEKIAVKSAQPIPSQILLYKRHHRMVFHLNDQYHTKIKVSDFQIVINNIHISNNYSGLGLAEMKNQKALYDNYKPVYDDDKSTISFDFENVSVNNFTIQVINTGAEGYIPQVFNLKNEESRDQQHYTVTLSQGASIGGTVSYNNKNVANARVYLDYSGQTDVSYNPKTEGGANAVSLLEARTDKNGYYHIRGIPISYDHQQVQIHATLDTNVTVNGQVKPAELRYGGDNKSTTLNFDLLTFDGPVIKSVYGFPLTVEHIEKSVNNTYKVTGLVDISKNNSEFKLLGGTEKIRVDEVAFASNNGKPYEPTLAAVPLEATTVLKMKYLDQYNVKLESPNNFKYLPLPLSIEKSATGGEVNAYVSIVDNSFNYPSSYLSFQDSVTQQPISFHLLNVQARGPDAKPMIIPAIYNTPAQNSSYHLADEKGNPLKFKFLGFNTTADPANSYIDPGDKLFHLDINFKANIPHSDLGYAAIHIKNMTLDGYSVKPTKGEDAIVVNLQTWQLIVKDWTIDPKFGGISSNNSYVSTKIVDVPVGNFKLRSDLFELDNFKVQNISLGGGLVNLTGIDTSRTHFLFDDACGSDHKGHWRLSASAKDEQTPAAIIPLPEIPGKFSATNINVDYFQLVSYNNENLINLAQTQAGIKMYKNNKFTFYPASLTSDIGAFSINGTAVIDVPRVGSSALSLQYIKTGNTIDADAGNFKPINFEGKGYVQFTSDKGALFKSKDYITTITGKVVEPGKFNPIPCTLSFGSKIGADANDPLNDNGTIALKQGYNLRMDGDGEAGPNDLALVITGTKNNQMKVDPATNDWGTLTFSGPMSDPKSNSENGGTADKMQKDPTIMTFNVLGDLQVTTSSVQMNNINTPLGNLALIYDFPSHELRGSLHMDNIQFGQYYFTGDIQAAMGPNGMLLLGSGQLNTGTIFKDGFGLINIGLLLGNTDLTEDNVTTVTQFSHAKNSLCWLDANRTGFKGFFLTGGVDVINEHDGVDIGIAAVYFNADLGVEASVGANFNNKDYMALLGAHGSVNAGLTSITGTSVSGGLSAHLTAVASYTQTGFAVNGDAGVTVKFTVSQYIPIIGTQSISAQKGAKVNFQLKHNDSYLHFAIVDDGNAVICTKNANVE